MITFDGAFRWLNKFSDRKSFLCDSSNFLLDDLHEAIADNNPAKVWNIVDRLKSVGESFGNCNECAEIRVRCAQAVYRLENYQSVIDLLSEAIKMYSPDEHHNITVARWMQGYVYWKMANKHDAARIAWQKCAESSFSLGRMFLETLKEEWYQNQTACMKNALELADQLGGWIARNPMDCWKILSLEANGAVNQNIGNVLIDRLLIDEEPFQFVPQIEIESGLFKDIQKQYVIQVNHDHMDRAGLEPGSYIVASYDTRSIESGDTVLAELVGHPPPVVLRRYIREGNKIFLRASSTSYYRDLVFQKGSKNFKICGKVLAQLVLL